MSPAGPEKAPVARGEQIATLSLDSLTLPVSDVRTSRDADYVERLAIDIGRRGVKHPLRVRSMQDGRYEILTGAYRFLAARLAGLTEIPCIVVEGGLSAADVLIERTLENEHRKPMSDVERGEAYLRLMRELNLNQERLAALLGLSPSALSKILKLVTSLADEVRDDVQAGRIPYTAACAIARLPDREQQKSIAGKYVAGLLCRDGVQLAVSKALANKRGSRARTRAKSASGLELAIPPMPPEELLLALKQIGEAVRKLVKNGLSVDALPDLLKNAEAEQ